MIGIKSGAKLKGVFEIECFRKGKLIWKERAENIITNQGLDAILDIMVHNATQIGTWYCVLAETDTAPAAGQTYAVPVYTEVDAKIDNGTRPEYVEAAASSQSITNSANKAVFTFNAGLTVYGASLVGGGGAPSTKSDVAGGGTLLCYAKFAASRAVVDDDVINLTYTLSAADDGV